MVLGSELRASRVEGSGLMFQSVGLRASGIYGL